MLARFGRSDKPYEAFLVALACVAAPEGNTDAAQVVALAERAATARTPWALEILGAALYRAGRLEEAVQRLTEASASTGGGGEATCWLFLAMGHPRLGHAAEARPWLAKAASWIDEDLRRQRTPDASGIDWGWRLILHHLRREAEALMPPAGPQ